MKKRKLKPLEYAFYLLKLRDRSVGEMKEKMQRKEYTPQEITEVISFLIEKNFLDDRRFAENYVRSKKLIKPTGKYYLRNKLMEKYIDQEIIEQVLNNSPDGSGEIEHAADLWLAKNKKVPKEKIYEKLSRHLISRGFEWDKVRGIVNEKSHRGGG